MPLEYAENKAWAHNFVVDNETFVQELVRALNRFVPRDNTFSFAWDKKDHAFIIQLQDKTVIIWLGPRVLFSTNRGKIPIYSILLTLKYQEKPSTRYSEDFVRDYSISNEESYTKSQLQPVFLKIQREILSEIERIITKR